MKSRNKNKWTDIGGKEEQLDQIFRNNFIGLSEDVDGEFYEVYDTKKIKQEILATFADENEN